MIDTHCHFDMMPNPEAYISAKEKAGDIVIGMTNLPSYYRMGKPHLRGYKHVRLALGLHPLLAAENKSESQLFKQLVDQTSYIGEIGLDFSRDGIATRDEQISVLREVLATLRGKKKIVSVHSRKAEKELLDLLCEYDTQNVIFHWYSGPVDLMLSILKQGYYFSINEAMCRTKNGRAIIERIPKERILTETDAPFNEKNRISEVLSYLNLSELEVYENFKSLLGRL